MQLHVLQDTQNFISYKYIKSCQPHKLHHNWPRQDLTVNWGGENKKTWFAQLNVTEESRLVSDCYEVAGFGYIFLYFTELKNAELQTRKRTAPMHVLP